MSMTITLPDDTAHRLELVAARRGVSAEALVVETIDVLIAGDEGEVDEAFLGLVDEVIVDHRPILDRLAT